MRKVLSFVLVLSLVLGSFGFAFAAPADVEGTDFETPVQVLMNLGIVTGYPDGTYKPEGAVTRAEMAALIVRALGLEDAADYVGVSSFSDMPGHWADKYVAIIAGKGTVNGYPDGTFQPDAQVSFPEAITMVVRSLGYIDGCEKLVGSWPVNYISLAQDLDITDDVKVLLAGAADRGAVAQMIYNALTVETVSVDNDGAVTIGSKTLLEEKHKATKETVKVTPKMIGDEDETLIDLSDYVYAYIDAFKDEDGVIIATTGIDDDYTDFVVGEFDLGDLEVTDADDDDYDVSILDGKASNAGVYLNGGEADYADVKDLLDGFEITVYGKLDDDDDDTFDKIDGIVAWAPTYEAMVGESDLDDIEDVLEDGSGEIFDVELPTVDNDGDELDFENIIVEGDVDDLEDIEEDDIVTIYASANKENKDDEYDKVKIVVTRDVQEIKVNKISGSKVYDSDNNEYKLASVELEVALDGVGIGDFSVGDVYDLYLDEFGYIFDIDEVDSTPDEYGIVVGFTDGDNFDDARIKLFTSEGDTVTFDVDDDDIANSIINNNVWGADMITGSVVSYNLTSRDVIDELDVVISSVNDDFGSSSYSARSDRWAGRQLDSDAVFFFVDDTGYSFGGTVDDSDWEVFSSLTDEDDYDAYYYRDGSKIAVMLIIDTTAATSDYFAVNKIYEVKNDSGDKVLELEGFLNGKSANVLTTKGQGDLVAGSETGFVYVVKYSGGAVKEATMVRTSAAVDGFGYVASRDSDGLDLTNKITEGAVATPNAENDWIDDYSDDVVVYLMAFDGDDPDDVEVGKVRDLRVGDLVMYILDGDGLVDMVFVVEAGDIDKYNAYMSTI